MSRSRPRRRVGTLLLIAAALGACDDRSPTQLEPTALDELVPGVSIDIRAPAITSADLVDVHTSIHGDPSAAPDIALSTPPEEAGLEIRGERTIAGISGGRAFAEGSHEYNGTLGRVHTTVSVAFENQHVGSHESVEQEWTWLPTSVWRKVWTYAWIEVDKTCGLSVVGQSVHETSLVSFDLNKTRTVLGPQRSTRANTYTQSSCGKQVTDQAPSAWYDSPPAGMTCMYLITYDRITYQVVDVELMGCSTSGTLF
jgi:hypothetical protein